MPVQLDDFFKKLFVVDPKKRINFSTITQHPLFAKYTEEFKENTIFYHKLEKNEEYKKDEVDPTDDYGLEQETIPEDESRSLLLKKNILSASEKALEREL